MNLIVCLLQVLINLVGNSVKFTDIGGEIVVVCSISCTTCYLRKMFGTSENSPYQHGGGDHECCDQPTHSPPTTKVISYSPSSSVPNSSSSNSSANSAMTNNEEVGTRIDRVEEKEKRKSSSVKLVNEMRIGKLIGRPSSGEMEMKPIAEESKEEKKEEVKGDRKDMPSVRSRPHSEESYRKIMSLDSHSKPRY